ncbi:MAG: peptidylprolyl isomerase [Planctomycetes bacterium]|nr:peptidylprolyl isomerase [Planctomycetota bacterium]
MNALLAMTSLPSIVEGLAWTLIHFLWQGLLIAVTLAATVRLGRVRGSALRYSLSLLALAAMCMAPVITLSVASMCRTSLIRVSEPSLNLPIAVDVGMLVAELNQVPQVAPIDSVQNVPDLKLDFWTKAQCWIVVGWVTGVALLSLRLLLGWMGVIRMRRDAVAAPDWLVGRMNRMSHTLKMAAPLLRVSVHVTEAMAIGFLKPMILFPAAWLTELPPDILESVIAHELAHIRRHDLWVNLAQRLLETALFYHPAVWWLSHRLRMERELCCDEMAVDVTQNPLRYAETLEAIGRLSLTTDKSLLTVSLTGSSDMLLNRVRNILRSRERSTCGWCAGVIPLSVACLISWSTMAASSVSGQSTDQSPAEPAAPIATAEAIPPVVPAASERNKDLPEWWGDLADEPVIPALRPTKEPYRDPWENWQDDTEEFEAQVAATVNGTPVLVGEVLARYSGYLTRLRQNRTTITTRTLAQGSTPPVWIASARTPADYERTRRELVKRDLPTLIQRRVLVERLKSKVSAKQQHEMHEEFEKSFENETKKLLRETNTSTVEELEVALRERGTTLQKIKAAYVDERMSTIYIQLFLTQVKVDDAEILAYYNSHQAEYAVPATITWQEIEVSYGTSRPKVTSNFATPANRLETQPVGVAPIVIPLTDPAASILNSKGEKSPPPTSREDARLRIAAAVRELQTGAGFDSIVEKYSEGATARTGGRWPDMDVRSLVDSTLARTLNELPLDEVSPILEGKSSFLIVRVLSRQPARTIAYADAQQQILGKLSVEKQRTQTELLFKSACAEAVIESRFQP